MPQPIAIWFLPPTFRLCLLWSPNLTHCWNSLYYLTWELPPPFSHTGFHYIFLPWFSSCPLFLVPTSSPSIIYVPRKLFCVLLLFFFASVHTFSLGDLIDSNGFNSIKILTMFTSVPLGLISLLDVDPYIRMPTGDFPGPSIDISGATHGKMSSLPSTKTYCSFSVPSFGAFH